MLSLCGLALLHVIVGVRGNPFQWALAAPQEEKPTFSITNQSSDICDAGSRQWTGTVSVTEEKSMFFWYFESRNQPEDAPVILWMSGGPGATGELGLFKDIGPCSVNKDGNSTSRNKYSWTDHANVLFIDQPIGVGFSKVKSRDNMAKNIHEAAQELEKFLSVFVSEVFPELTSKPWHFAGESFGGHYVTYYLHHLLNEKPHESPLLNVSSAIIVDGYIDGTRQSAGYYDFFCQDWREDGSEPLMSTRECEEMASHVPECERLGELCRQTLDVEVCRLAATRCEWTVGKHFLDNVKPGGWNPYDSRKKCIEPPICSDLHGGATLQFLNRPWVQERLGFSDVAFELIDFDLNRQWDTEGSIYLPTTKQLTWLLDETDIHVLFINGNNDIIISTPGQMRLLDEQPWSRQAWYRAQRYSNWYVEDGELSSSPDSKKARQGGTWKGDERLALFTVDEAGHTCPFDQSEAVGAVVRNWIRLDSVEGQPRRTGTKVCNEL
ncbi:carboxypeptidase Y [Fusarium proliferatum]|nr:carboxypeptidase Y [Fusarium proliferatum]